MVDTLEEKAPIETKEETPGATTFAELFKGVTDEPETPTAESEKPAEEKPVTEAEKKEPLKAEAGKKDEKETEKVDETAVKFNIKKTKPAPAEQKPAAESKQEETKPAAETKPAPAKVSREEQLKALGVDEFTIQLIKHKEAGGDVAKYLEVKGRDWTKVSDIDVVKAKIKAENSFLNEKQLATLTKIEMRKYGLNEDASEEEKEIGEVLLTKDAYNFRQAAIAEDAKFQIPAAKPAEDNKEQGPTAQEIYANELKSNPETLALLQSKKVVADGGKPGYKVSFDIDQPEELVNLWTDPATYAKHMLDASGKPNVAKQNLMSLVAIDPSFVFNTLIDHGRQLEKQASLTEKQNIEKKEPVIPSNGGKKTLGQAFAEEGKDLKMSDLG